MPKPITVRFYQVGKVSPHGPSLRTVLQQIFDLGEPGTRHRQLSGAFTCRLERLNTATPGHIAGEMVRVRSTDLPCEVHPDGTHALSVDVPIGDGVAFWFREQDHKLAIQYDMRTLSPGRFNDYFHQMVDAAYGHHMSTGILGGHYMIDTCGWLFHRVHAVESEIQDVTEQ